MQLLGTSQAEGLQDLERLFEGFVDVVCDELAEPPKYRINRAFPLVDGQAPLLGAADQSIRAASAQIPVPILNRNRASADRASADGAHHEAFQSKVKAWWKCSGEIESRWQTKGAVVLGPMAVATTEQETVVMMR